VQSLAASVLVMGVMLSLACCPIGFMLADMTRPSAEDGSASSSGSLSMSASESGSTFGWEEESESEGGIAWWWPAVVVNGLSLAIVTWVWLSGMVLPTSWGPWRLSDKRLWVDKCCASCLPLCCFCCSGLLTRLVAQAWTRGAASAARRGSST